MKTTTASFAGFEPENSPAHEDGFFGCTGAGGCGAGAAGTDESQGLGTSLSLAVVVLELWSVLSGRELGSSVARSSSTVAELASVVTVCATMEVDGMQAWSPI